MRTLDPGFARIRDREFSRLTEQAHAYLDYGGSALYADSQVRAHAEILRAGVFGNPHSEHEPSQASSALLDEARARALRFFDADGSTHAVCFTANATAAIKLVAESYPFAPGVVCALTADNHNSVNGLREYTRRAGASIRYLPLDRELRLLAAEQHLAAAAAGGRGLFAFPAQSNFSGVRHPHSLIACAHHLGLDVLIDVAAYVSSSPFSLRACPADFAVVSFYKLFGYPTGIGALIATHDALGRLRRPWFAGGTVEYVSVQLDRHRLRAGAEGFEDGTPSFLAAAALPAGFDLLERIGMCRIRAHVDRLTGYLLGGLTGLRHPHGTPAVRIYGPATSSARGGTVAFNVIDRDGQPVPCESVERRMRDAGISVRGGCFCNPGAAEAAFGFDAAHAARCLDRAGGAFSIERFATCLGPGVAVGAIRISLGLANDRSDIDRALDVLASFCC